MPSLKDINWNKVDDRWDFIKQREQRIRERNALQHHQWYLDVAFYLGYQNQYYDRRLKTVREAPAPSWRVRSISNILLPMARQTVAALARIEPIWEVLPATRDMRDVQIARLGTDVGAHYWYQLKCYFKYLKALFWTVTTGNGFWKIGWDPDIGSELPVPQDDGIDQFLETILGEKITQQNRPQSFRPGDNFVDYKSPFELMFQEGAMDIEQSLYCIDSTVQDIYNIQDKYGSRANKIHPDSDLTRSGLLHLDTLENLTGPMFKEHYTPASRRDQAIVYEVYVKPHKKLKDGMHFIMSQSKDIKKPVPFPFKHGHLPYVHFPEVPVPGRFHATSTLTQNRPNQTVMNRFDSQIIEYINLMLKGKWLVAKGAKVNEITDAPGQIIRYNHPFKPEQARLLPFPRSIFDMREVISRSIQDTASSHDTSRGKSSGSVRSGSLAESLKESDLSVLGPTQLLHDMALAEAGAQLIQNTAQFVTEERLISVVRGGKLAAAKRFIGSDLVGEAREVNANYSNVIVTATGRAPWSKAAQRELIRVLLEGGILRPREHDDLILKSVGLDSAAPLFEQAELARNKQFEESSQFLNKGIEIPPNRQDQHAVHLNIMDLEEENLDFWQKLPPEAQDVRRTHRAMHEQLQARAIALPALLVTQAQAALMKELKIVLPPQAAGSNGNARRPKQRA